MTDFPHPVRPNFNPTDNPCEMQWASIQAPGTTDVNGLDFSTQAGRFLFRTKRIPSYWMVVHSLAYYQDNPTGGPAIDIEIGFVSETTPTALPGAPVLPRPRVVIFDSATPPLTPVLKSVVNTNFGQGWIVPVDEGVPMSVYLVTAKDEISYPASLGILWSYVPLLEVG